MLMSSTRGSDGAGSSNERHHGAELLAQLGERWKIARDADRLDELAHDLRLGVHGASADPDVLALEEPERLRLAHGGVGELQRGRRRLRYAHGVSRPMPGIIAVFIGAASRAV